MLVKILVAKLLAFDI